MNSIIQLVIKFFQSLFRSGPNVPTSENTHQPTPAPAPAPQPEPLIPDPVIPEPAEPVVIAPEPAPEPTGPLPPSHGLQEKALPGSTGISITDGEVEGTFKKFEKAGSSWKGWYTGGQRSIKDFIEAERELLNDLKLTKSAQNLLQAVSENEGKLEAINAYDGAFLSFGIFQWTLGVGDSVGELPALLKKLKTTYPDTFQQYFGRFGLGVAEQTNSQTGYLTLNGELINTRDKKEQFRSMHWVYRFWRAGRDRLVQAIEVQHALSRLETFYWRYEVYDFTLNQIITSEYGVALLLDNHVNLPGLVKAALREAMTETGLRDPGDWGDEEEKQVLKAYVDHRATRIGNVGPMYDAKGRAKRTANYVKEGIISDARGTLNYSPTRSRSTGNFVPEPAGYDPSDHPDLELELEGRDMEFLIGVRD